MCTHTNTHVHMLRRPLDYLSHSAPYFPIRQLCFAGKKKKQKQNLKLSILSHFYAIALFLKCYDSECFQDLSLILKAVDGGG